MNIPITPEQKDSSPNGVLLNNAISYINDKILSKDWHDNFADPIHLRQDYFAIIIAPYHRYNDRIMQEVVIKFREKGWGCLYGNCYDARGPHSCFYVSKKHFEKE